MVAKALCYKMLGVKDSALLIIEKHLQETDTAMPYDYIHLGVLYLDIGAFDKALEAFNKQSEYNELADNQYYISRVHEALGNDAQRESCLRYAVELYKQRRFMNDVYTHPVDKVYLGQIENEIMGLR